MSAAVNFDALAALPRAAIAHLVEKLIDRMDAMEPDADLEDSEASNPLVDDRGNFRPGSKLSDIIHLTHEDAEVDDDGEEDDHSGDSLDEHGELDPARGLDLPRYGVDQTKGPVNQNEAWRNHYARLRAGDR